MCATVGWYDDVTSIFVLGLLIAHRLIGRVVQTNYFEVMFRVTGKRLSELLNVGSQKILRICDTPTIAWDDDSLAGAYCLLLRCRTSETNRTHAYRTQTLLVTTNEIQKLCERSVAGTETKLMKR